MCAHVQCTSRKGSQGEDLLFRYRLTSQPGYDAAAASRFAMETTVPPLVVRVSGAETGRKGQFLSVAPEGVAEVHIKRAIDGRGVIIHASNLTADAQELKLGFPSLTPSGAWQCSPIEEDGAALPITGDGVVLSLPPRSVACARVVLE